MKTRKSRNLPYKEGTWFAVPLRSQGYALGVVARLDGCGGVLGYFFGPALERLPKEDRSGFTAEEAVYLKMFGDLGLIDGQWPLLSQDSSWNRSEWPLPAFVRADDFEKKAWKCEYSDTLELISERPCAFELAEHYPKDGLAGYGAVEIKLSSILGSGASNEQETLGGFKIGDGSLIDNDPPLRCIQMIFADLDQIRESSEEVTDTEVRDAVHETLNYFFVWGRPTDRLPVNYRMFSQEGDQAVAQAVERFLKAAADSPDVAKLALGQERLDALQHPDIETPSGFQSDDFIGYVETPLEPEPLPESRFEVPDYESF